MDFNDHKITKAQKEDYLRQQIDSEYKKERAKYGYEPSLKFYRIKIKELIEINKDAQSNDGNFDLYEESLKQFYPDFFVPFYECERLEKGEWDEVMRRYTDRDIVRGVVELNGGYYLTSKNNGSLWIGRDKKEVEEIINDITVDDDDICFENWDKLHFQYPRTFAKDYHLNFDKAGGGCLIEFNPKLLKKFKKGQKGTKINESFYQEERIYSIKEAYQIMIDGMMKSYWDDKERKEARRNRKRRKNRTTIVKKIQGQGFQL